MKRDIKFRAWDDEDNKIINWDDLELQKDLDYNDWLVWKNIDPITKEARDFKLMQYTGLKDKNDAGSCEVYEHDILYNGKGQYFKVEWDYRNTGWCGINIYNSNKKNLVELLLKHSVVVGNIHENKDLLNG